MDLKSVYVANGAGVLLLIILLYISRTRILRRKTEDKIYTGMILGVMVACCCEALSYTIDGKVFPGCLILNHLLNTYLFSANLMMSFCVLIYVDLGLYNDTGRIWRCYKPQIIIGVILLIVNVVNLFVPITYHISEENVYERMPFGYVYYVVILYYFISGILLTRRYRKEQGTIGFFNIHLFLFPVLIGFVLQVLFYGLSLAWLAGAMGLVGLFMMQQNEMAYVDVLTGLYNRQYMNYILTAWISSGKGFAGMMMDIDNFKKINDTCSHSEGDQALMRFADLMKKARNDNELIFRFAGDEFIVLRLTDSSEGLAEYQARLNVLLAEYNRNTTGYPLQISSGMCYYQLGNMDSFMREMDAQMYRMKAAHHSTPETDRRKNRVREGSSSPAHAGQP